MNIQSYIYSGILEQYCLGMLNDDDAAFVVQMTMLYPEVKNELSSIEQAFEYFAQDGAIRVSPKVRANIIKTIEHTFSDAVLDINNLPEIKKTSNLEAWYKCVEPLIPVVVEDFNLQVLRSEGGLTQMLVVSRIDVPEESHGDVFESLYILRGTCECSIGDKIVRMEAGDYIDIPLHVEHNVKIVSPYVVAIVQHKAVA
ncbi:cupin domain-containing protein [Mucilaginibacter sp. HMF5004]|uniref:cupin domain-containing protein n=1 Tax=Mucilaginibacter rivuli TaxID=2857527 RepID=UPI001C5E079A|nr:cupin domain-containing protein [Mucilaginibacter rivuli]MBW4891895.1 cupin domain-containing protein [Mucilaginibacter rivuli]